MLGSTELHSEVVYLLEFGVPALVLGALVALRELQGRAAVGANGTEWDTDLGHEPAGRSVALWVAAVGLMIAAVIHACVAPSRFREYVPFGVFFVILAATQMIVAIALVRRPDHRTVGYVALASVGVVALWLVSRSTGMPVGPEPWEPMPYGVPDVVASCAELVTAVGCAMELWTLPEQRTMSATSAHVEITIPEGR
jgi:hypothetical protein